MSFEKGQTMAGYKSVIELLVEELAEALERIEKLEEELLRRAKYTTTHGLSEKISSVLGPHEDI